MIFQNIFEPVRKVDAPEELRPESELPPLEMPEPNFFDGMGDTWKAIPNAVLDTASSAITGLRQIPLENFTTQPEVREWVRRQREEVMPANARRIREIAKQEYELDPQTSGTAAQIVYGLGEMIPKAVLYGSVAGPAGGALLFGADVGVNRTQTLLDEGVDEQTAIDAGMLTFATNAIGLKLPAAFATGRRLTSAAIGAGANVGLNVAEVQGVHWILENQNYDELAKNYELNFADNAVAAGLGAAFGAAFWRPTTSVRFEQERKTLSERFATELERTGKFTPQQVTAQANLNASVVTSAASRWGLTPEQVSRVAPRVRVDSATTADGFDMPISQGKEWHMGPTKLSPEERVIVVQYKGQSPDRQTAIEQISKIAEGGVKNEETGFLLSASTSDIEKSAGRYFSYNERLVRAIAPVFDEIVAKAKLLESSRDVRHNNPDVQGIHTFATPVDIDGGLYRVQLTVRDYVTPNQERLSAHTIAGVQIYEIENPPASMVADGGSSDIRAVPAPTIRLVSKPGSRSDHTVSLSELVGGRRPYVRTDGKGLFDAVEESSFAENGVYYEAPVFNQTAWHGSPHQFDRFSTEHIGSGEGAQMHGWGLYFADDQAVADRYRGSLVIGRGGNEYSIAYKGARPEELPQSLRVGLERLKGNVLHIDSDIRREYESLVYSLNERFDAADRIAKVYEGLIAQIDENPKQSISSFLARVPEDEKYRADLAVKSARAAAKNEGRRASVHDVRTQLNDSLAAVDQQRRENKEPLDALRQIDPDDLTVEYDSGRVFKVDIPDSDKMLDEQKLWGAGSNFELKAKIRGMISEWNGDHLDTEQMIYVPDRPTGRDVYQAISKAMGGPKQASLWLKERGIEGITYVGGTDGRCYVVFDDQAIEVLDFYQRNGSESLGSYSPTENRITLAPNANVSTFSHEIGHWYLHNLMQASQFEEAAGNVKQDVDVLLKAFGINSVDDWNALGVNGQRKYHERFASWVEQYLSEGKSPSPSLVSFFKRFAEWLKDVYEHFSDAVGGRYQAEFGEELPPLSAEVRKVLDRMYTDEFGSKTVRPDKTQVAAARAVQAEEINREKRNRILATDSEDDYSKAVAAQRKAASDLNSGTPIDVSQQMRGASLNEQVLGAEQKRFAREVMAGDGRTAVVLQNRDRSNVVSVGQMNSIASDPQYGLLSFSRNTASGAPIVSYGTLPDDAYLGVRDYVIDSGEQVPVQYAVVEADTVQTSNRFDGSQNPDYGDASLMNVVAGNGRLTGLTEAYRRGTAQQYRDALMSDTQHGVEPAVIASMQHPVLVRYMPQEKVSTGFVSRSNSDQVMARSNVEIAAEDAPRIRENASLYRFDEEGMPTAETVRQFLIDIGEPNALGRLINSNGNPTPEAIRRIQTAVFHEAYQNDVLTELFSSTTDANIKRILTVMAAFAPRIIEMRNSGIDLAQGIVEAANAVRMAREEGRSLQDLVSQLSFLDDPTTTPFIELLARNANSAAAIGRVLEPLADWTVNAMRAADGGLFGDENVVRTDVADVLGQMRRIENEQRVAAGQEPLPELDVAAIRASIQNLQSQLDEIASQASAQVDVPAQVEPNPQQVQATVREGVANDPDAIRMQELASQQPEQTFLFEDEDGQTIEMRFDEVETRMQEIENEGKTEASGIAQAAICIMRNDGAQ